MKLEIKRIAFYVLGFVLFYTPFAFFQKLIYRISTGKWQDFSIHSLCFRIPIEHILDGRILTMDILAITGVITILTAALFFGPLFCGRLCPAGAFMEYISRCFPARFQIKWSNYADIAPIRYGMLAGFMILPFFQGILACAYCNFFLFDLFINYFIFGYFISLSSSLLLTLLLWAVVFGVFTKGGRGYCNFLCPVGAVQNLIYSFSSRLPFTYKLTVLRNKCIKCHKCIDYCPMDSMNLVNGKVMNNIHNCILCGVCIDKCPVQAIVYGRKGQKNEK